jgi:hypothetical protein
MREIRSRAEHLMAWIGEESDNSSLAMHLIRTAGAGIIYIGIEEISLLRQNNFNPCPWVPFRRLVRTASFSRLWVT